MSSLNKFKMDRSNKARRELEQFVSSYTDSVQARLDSQQETIEKLFGLVNHISKALNIGAPLKPKKIDSNVAEELKPGTVKKETTVKKLGDLKSNLKGKTETTGKTNENPASERSKENCQVFTDRPKRIPAKEETKQAQDLFVKAKSHAYSKSLISRKSVSDVHKQKPEEQAKVKMNEISKQKVQERSSEKPQEKPIEKQKEKSQEKPQEKPQEKQKEKTTEKQKEKPQEKQKEKTTEKQKEKPQEKQKEKTTEKLQEKPQEKQKEKIIEKTQEKTTEKPKLGALDKTSEAKSRPKNQEKAKENCSQLEIIQEKPSQSTVKSKEISSNTSRHLDNRLHRRKTSNRPRTDEDLSRSMEIPMKSIKRSVNNLSLAEIKPIEEKKEVAKAAEEKPRSGSVVPMRRMIGVKSIDDIKKMMESQKKEESRRRLEEKKRKPKWVRNEPKSENEEEMEDTDKLQLIDIEISQLTSYKKEGLETIELPNHVQLALESLQKIPEKFLDKPIPSKTKWAICTFFTLLGRNVPEDTVEETWREYCSAETAPFKPDLSQKNLDRVEALLKGKRNLLDPALFIDWPLARTLVLIISETLKRAGVFPSYSKRRYVRLLHMKRQLQSK